MAELQAWLDGMPSQDVSSVIRAYLDAGRNIPTGLDFKVGPGGWVADSPSLRVFLLDHLARIDPAGAAEYARAVLSSMDSPDEWTVSLRNYALADSTPAGRTYLQQKVGEMLCHEPWQQNPSVGFLEAFDVAVYLGGTNLVPPLTDLIRKKDNRAVTHAAYLAMDRLTLRDAAATLGLLEANPELMAGREVTRANFFARANVENPREQAVVESYLLNPSRSAEEVRAFAGLFPNANYMVSHNLLTRVETPTADQIARRDQAALRVVEGWLTDPRFAGLQPHLQQVKNRLERFVGSDRSGR